MKSLKLLYYIPEFIVFYLAKLVQANFFMAYIILSPKMKTQPGFIEFPLKIKSPAGLLLFSNLMSMTPGSLSADISNDRKTLLLHILITTDEQKIMKDIESIQKRILRLTN
jgi:multisubunit Na+/H+ antiporter MnhE subunit